MRSDIMSNLKQMGAEPVGGLLSADAPEGTFPRDLKNDDAVLRKS